MASRVVVPLGPAHVDMTGVRSGDRNLMYVSITRDGAPYDLTGLEVTAQARKRATDADPTMTAEVAVTDALAGKLELRWPGDEVAAALAGKATWCGVWDMQLQAAGEDAVTVAGGTIDAAMDVTR